MHLYHYGDTRKSSKSTGKSNQDHLLNIYYEPTAPKNGISPLPPVFAEFNKAELY